MRIRKQHGDFNERAFTARRQEKDHLNCNLSVIKVIMDKITATGDGPTVEKNYFVSDFSLLKDQQILIRNNYSMLL